MILKKRKITAFLAGILLAFSAFPIEMINVSAEDGLPENVWTEDPLEHEPSLAENHSSLHLIQGLDTNYMVEDTSLPASYDLRNVNGVSYVTSVKDQKSTGTCWAHAVCAAAESNALKTGLADELKEKYNLTGELDFSESHLVWYGACQRNEYSDSPLFHKGVNRGAEGGYKHGLNAYLAAGILSSIFGTNLESKFFPVAESPNFNERFGSVENSEKYRFNGIAYVKNVDFFRPSYYNTVSQQMTLRPATMKQVKESLQENGAMYFSYYDTKDEKDYANDYSEKNAAYYHAEYTDSNNHAVTLIGWDDNFPKENFTTQPPADGAWLCKNSWGTNFGNNGYFYISYYDGSISYLASYQMESKDNYDAIAQYDSFAGDENSLSQYNFSTLKPEDTSKAITGADVLKYSKSYELESVSFWTDSANVTYNISIYTDVQDTANPTSGTQAYQKTDVMSCWGYHVVKLDTPEVLKKNKSFSVVISLCDKTYPNYTCFYYDGNTYPDAKPLPKNLSFYADYDMTTGEYSEWHPVTNVNGEAAALRIKAFLKAGLDIDAENFPSDRMQSFASRIADKDGNGFLTNSEINEITAISWNLDERFTKAYSWEGVENFTNIENVYLKNAPLVALDLSKNKKVKTFTCSNCGVDIKEMSAAYFETLNIDTTKIKTISGAEIQDGKIIPTSKTVSYTYDCGNNLTATFTIKADAMKGDLNADDLVNANDVRQLQNFLHKKPAKIQGNADLNGDGIWNIYDLILLKREAK